MSGTAIYGIYHRDDIQGAVDILRRQGFRNTDISLLLFPATYTGALDSPESAPEVPGRKWRVSIEALAIPGVGPLIAVGPLMTGRQGQRRSDIKCLVRLLVELGVPESEARRYESRIKSGDILLSLHCGRHDEVTRAEKLLKKTGAEDVTSSSLTRADLLPHHPKRSEISPEFHH